MPMSAEHRHQIIMAIEKSEAAMAFYSVEE